MRTAYDNDQKACYTVIANKLKRHFAFHFFFSQLFLFASAVHSVLFVSQMNYGLNARANVLCTIQDENRRGKKRKKTVDAREKEREREFFFAITVEKWKQNGDIEERKKNKSGSSFHLLLLLVSVANSIGHGPEPRAAGNNCTNNDNNQQFNGKEKYYYYYFFRNVVFDVVVLLLAALISFFFSSLILDPIDLRKLLSGRIFDRNFIFTSKNLVFQLF